MKNKKSNYQIQLEKAQLEFPKWKHEEIARKYELTLDATYLYIKFFKSFYRIHRVTGQIERESVTSEKSFVSAGFNEVMSILDLLSYAKAERRLTGQWSSVNHLSGMAHAGQAVGSDLFAPYAAKFDGRIPRLCAACQTLGGEKAPYADVSYILEVFEGFPVMLQFWNSDDEFSAQLKLLWDTAALDYVHFETTFYIAFYLLGVLEKLMGDCDETT
ncbi:MAG: DUF3786 domain-containing protein [Lachnospiraceae bacterium]